MAKYWRHACNMKVLITQDAISEVPRQTWRFKEDFSGGNNALRVHFKILKNYISHSFFKRMVQFLTTEISIYQSLLKFNLSF